MREIFEQVEKKINAGEEILKEMSLITGMVYLNEYMDRRINDLKIQLSHGTRISIVMRQKGGSDPRVQELQNCPNKKISGLFTPSVRACPFCGTPLQHCDQCKKTVCPACRNVFCFICLKSNEGGLLYGGWGTKCIPAPRQTRICG